MPLSTDGIGMGELSTSTWVTARRKGKTDPVTFQTYDFGGQMVFYPTHQLFLTARSIYLVVFNVVEDDRTHVLYWLKQVPSDSIYIHITHLLMAHSLFVLHSGESVHKGK
jgi:hypothetical protein